MTTEIDILFWPRGGASEQNIAKLLERYHQQAKSVLVRARSMDAQNPWADVSRIMLQRKGADISELGASWVGSLVATESLRPFSAAEIELLGGLDAFLLPAWESEEGGTVHSIPHLVDSRHVYYRRDLLAKAGVKEETAFNTSENFLQTLESLKRAGVQTPLLAPISVERMNLSFVASWIWGAGAEIVDKTDGRAVFGGPKAVSGIADYFRMIGYIPLEYRQMGMSDTDQAFCRGEAAITLSGTWLFYVLQEPEFAQVNANMGIAVPINQACWGGTHLAIWQHCIYTEAAFDLIRFLSSAQVQADYSSQNFILPTLKEAIRATPYASNPNYQMLVDAIRLGRSYGASRLWNVVEERLSRLLVQMWMEYYTTAGLELNSFLASRLELLAKRINLALEG